MELEQKIKDVAELGYSVQISSFKNLAEEGKIGFDIIAMEKNSGKPIHRVVADNEALVQAIDATIAMWEEVYG